MKRRFFIHFEITKNCITAGMRNPGHRSGKPDVFDNLAAKLRDNPHVRQMLEHLINDEDATEVCVGVGRKYDE